MFGIFLELDLLRKSTDELASSRKIGDIRTTTLRRFMSGPLLALALRAAGAEEASAAASCPPEPNPPAWPPSVRVFSPDDPSAAARAELAALGEELNDRARGHFFVGVIPVARVPEYNTLTEKQRDACVARYEQGFARDVRRPHAPWTLAGPDEPATKLRGAAPSPL